MYEQSIIQERNKLAVAIKQAKNDNEKQKLLEQDEKLRLELSSRYAATDPVHAHMRATAQRRMDNFLKHGSTDGPKR